MPKRIKNLSKRHFQNNFIMYFTISIFFLVGIIIGSILINRLTSEQNYRIINRYSWMFDYEPKKNQMDIFKSILFSNIKFTFIIWLIGLTSLGTLVIPLMISFRGGVIGFTVGFLIKEFGIQGFTFSLSGLLPHYLIILPGILAIGAIGLSNSINSNNRRRGKSLNGIYQKTLIDYSILFLLFFLIVVIGCFVEAFITPYFLNFVKFNV